MSDPGRPLSPLLEARAVAVLGASADPAKLGGRPIRFMRSLGFAGSIHPVNPRAERIQDLPAVPSIDALPDGVDHAIVALPADKVIEAVSACAARGIRSATIFSAGFGELGAEGRRQEARLGAIARDAGMRLLGPNCMGFMNLRRGLIASFAFMVELGLPPIGRVALVSQSGAFGGQALVMARERGLPLGAWVTTGNECDIELADCIAHFAADDETDVIMGYMEGCRSADRLIAALSLARARGKPVILVKAGGSAVGGEAVRSHTGALAGNDRVFDGIFRQYGVHRARSIDGFFDAALAASAGRFPTEGRVGIFTVSGGVGILMADAAEAAGLAVPALPEATQARLKALLPLAAVRNPIDGTAQIWSDMDRFAAFLDAVARDGGLDALVLFLTAMPHSPPLQQPLERILTALRAAHPHLVMVLSMLAPPALGAALARAGYLIFEDPTRAIEAVAALRDLGRTRAMPWTPPIPAAPLEPPALPDTGPIDEAGAKRVLAAAGIPVVPEATATDPDDACRAATRLGYPVALKILSPDVLHKTEIGGVALDLADDTALRRAWHALSERFRAALPDARLSGMLVAPMIRDGIELILGIQRDPVFGPVVLVGLGGIHAELLDDTAVRPAPVDHATAHAMLRQLRGFAVLDGARNRPRADLDAVADAIVRLSRLGAAAPRVASIDVNPLIARHAGRGVVALDAAILLHQADPADEDSDRC